MTPFWRVVLVLWWAELLVFGAAMALTRAEKIAEAGRAPPLWVYALIALVMSILAPPMLALAAVVSLFR